jgi:hypothetical protein
MKIIDAFWEKRNLGVDCKEIVIEENDSVSSVSNIIASSESTEYLVMKVPTGRVDLYEILTVSGFTFVEGSIHLMLNLKESVLSPLQQRLNSSILYAEMEKDDLDELFNEIRNGVFKSDRIILDRHFSKVNASDRYINWISDEIARGSQAYKILYKGESIGFFTFKTLSDDTYYPFLAGLYEKFSSSGLGFTTIRKPIEEAVKRKGKFISTHVSTNNAPIVRVHIQQGFAIQEIQYIFVRHNKN